MFERGALRFAQVMQDGAGRAHRRLPVGQAAAIEREQMEMVAQRAVGVIEAEDPVFEFGAQITRALLIAREQWQFGGEQHFARAKLLDGGRDVGGIHFRDAEFAGRDIHMRHAGAVAQA